MRQRPKRANYLEKLIKEKEDGGRAKDLYDYDNDGHLRRLRDPSPIVANKEGGPVGRLNNTPRGINNVSGAGKKKVHESSLSAVPGAVVRQYRSLDDVPDGLPESPKWGTVWVPRSVAVSPRAGYQEEEENDTNNYWTSNISHAPKIPIYNHLPASNGSRKTAELSPREEAGYSTYSQSTIPRRSHQPMRPMPQQHYSELDDQEWETDAVAQDPQRIRHTDALVRDSHRQFQAQPKFQQMHSKLPDGYGYNYDRNDEGGDEEGEEWERDSLPDRKDTPPRSTGGYSSQLQYYDEDDYEYRTAKASDPNGRMHGPKSSGYGARPQPAMPSAADNLAPRVKDRERGLSHRQENKSLASATARDYSRQQLPTKEKQMKIEQSAPPLPVEMGPGDIPVSNSGLSDKEALYFSRQPRNVEYKPYSLASWKQKKPQDYVEIKPTLQPDLNSQELLAKRANHERVKEFSRQLLAYNQKVLQAQRKLPRSSESSDLEKASQKLQSKRERAMLFAQGVPKPRPAVPLTAAAPGSSTESFEGRRIKSQSSNSAHRRADNNSDDEDGDWGGKASLDEDYMHAPFHSKAAQGGMNDVEFRRIEQLEQKHNDSQRQIAAIRKALLMG